MNRPTFNEDTASWTPPNPGIALSVLEGSPHLNLQRSALQVLGCNQKVVMHLPVEVKVMLGSINDEYGPADRTPRLPVKVTDIVRVGPEVSVVAGQDPSVAGVGYPTHVVLPDGMTRKLEGEVPLLQRRPSASQRHLTGGGCGPPFTEES